VKLVRSYILAGLIVWLPVLLTIFVFQFIIRLFDSSMAFISKDYQINVPGFGVLCSLIILIVTGFIATNVIGQYLVRWSEILLEKIPFVRSVYKASKQLIQTLFSNNSQAFRKAVLIEYPRKGLWTIAFQTGPAMPEIIDQTEAELISIFVPTTPNPTGGYLIMLPKNEIIELNLSVDAAFKFIISLGVMQPTANPDIYKPVNKKSRISK